MHTARAGNRYLSDMYICCDTCSLTVICYSLRRGATRRRSWGVILAVFLSLSFPREIVVSRRGGGFIKHYHGGAHYGIAGAAFSGF